MNCRYARANFSGYIEQELSEAERREVSAHLSRCSSCTSELFAMQKAMSLVRWVPRCAGRPGFEERLMRRIAVLEQKPARTEPWRGVLSTLAARWDDLVSAMMVPAPVGALLVALLLGGGGGAFLLKSMNAKPEGITPAVTAARTDENPASPAPAQLAAATGETETATTSAPTAEGPTALVATPPARAAAPPAQLASADTKPPASARVARNRPPRTQLVGTGAGTARQVEVASWASQAQPIDAIPEGPPAVSEVEYILHLIDANGQPVELPASAIVSGGTVTF
jgi:hypothetical protein